LNDTDEFNLTIRCAYITTYACLVGDMCHPFTSHHERHELDEATTTLI